MWVRIGAGVLALLLLVGAAWMFFRNPSCPEQGCRDYSSITMKDGGLAPVNDGEALVMLSDRLARREKIHQDELAAVALRESARRDQEVAAYQRGHLEAQTKRIEEAEDRDAALRRAYEEGTRSGSAAHRNPCGSAAWRPCR
ncbi:MAG: hypothetical protein AAB608_02705 [Patescibacteria group bacterium]